MTDILLPEDVRSLYVNVPIVHVHLDNANCPA
jgi:hypothetical protein